MTTALEAMAMHGRDPRTAAAEVLGISGINRAGRLQAAGALSLREVARYGNDATTYKGRTPGEWLSAMFELADQAPHLRVTDEQKQTLQKAYATQEESAAAIRQWCRDHGVDSPTAQTYFDLGLGTPATYIHAHYMHLRQTSDNEAAVRGMELAAGQALHQASYRQRESARH